MSTKPRVVHPSLSQLSEPQLLQRLLNVFERWDQQLSSSFLESEAALNLLLDQQDLSPLLRALLERGRKLEAVLLDLPK